MFSIVLTCTPSAFMPPGAATSASHFCVLFRRQETGSGSHLEGVKSHQNADAPPGISTRRMQVGRLFAAKW